MAGRRMATLAEECSLNSVAPAAICSSVESKSAQSIGYQDESEMTLSQCCSNNYLMQRQHLQRVDSFGWPHAGPQLDRHSLAW
jgi:hypothetical protein